MSWFKADVAFGHVEVDSPLDWNPFAEVGNHAPSGPYHNPGWNRIGDVKDAYHNYNP